MGEGHGPESVLGAALGGWDEQWGQRGRYGQTVFWAGFLSSEALRGIRVPLCSSCSPGWVNDRQVLYGGEPTRVEE